MIPTLTLCSLDRVRGMVDVYNYIIRVVNILKFIHSYFILEPFQNSATPLAYETVKHARNKRDCTSMTLLIVQRP